MPVDAAVHRICVIFIAVNRHSKRWNRGFAGNASAGATGRRISGAYGARASSADVTARSQFLAGATVDAVNVEARGGVEGVVGSVVAILRDLAGIVQLRKVDPTLGFCGILPIPVVVALPRTDCGLRIVVAGVGCAIDANRIAKTL